MDYVIEHEAAHIEVRDHSARFWALLDERVPDWRDSRLWLKRHGGDAAADLAGCSGPESAKAAFARGGAAAELDPVRPSWAPSGGRSRRFDVVLDAPQIERAVGGEQGVGGATVAVEGQSDAAGIDDLDHADLAGELNVGVAADDRVGLELAARPRRRRSPPADR